MSEVVSNNDATEEDHLVDSEIKLSATSAEQDLSEIDENNLEFEDSESESLHNAQVSDEIQEFLTDEITSADSEEGIDLDEDVSEEDFEYEEPVTQVQNNVESSLVDLSLSVQQTKPAPDISMSETDSEIQNSTTLAKDEFDPQIQKDSDPNLSVEKVEQNENDELDGAEMDICVEEKKLARQIEINPRSATTWEALGTLYKTAGRYDEAIQAFEQAISIKPSEVSYFHNLGLVYAAQGNNQEAFNTFQKVLELDPNHSLTHASLGGYYKKIGLDELAQKHIGKAMKHIYESENEYNRACLDAICGNFDQAIKLLRIALENEQTYVDWVLSDPDLDPLRDDERFKQLVADFSN
jgi:tetratricopeptide (TPR) repeat protein